MRKLIKPAPQEGQRRIKRGFLIFPKTLRLPNMGGLEERRWLVKTAWAQKCVEGAGYYSWESVEWIPDEENNG